MHADVADEFLFVEEFALDKGNLFVCLYRSKDELFPRFEKKGGGGDSSKDRRRVKIRMLFERSKFFTSRNFIW